MNLFLRRNPSELNIIFVIDSLVMGGAESQLVMLAAGLQRRGYCCKVFALNGDGVLRARLDHLGIPVWNGRVPDTRSRIALLLAAWKLWLSVRRSRPCVIHAYLPLSNFIGSVIGKLAGASIVITSRRALGIHQELEPLYRRLDKISNALSTCIAVNSSAVRDDTINRDGVDRNKIVCIHNGLDVSQFDLPPSVRSLMRSKLGLSNTDFAWVMVANLVDYKGHVDLLHAFASMASFTVAHWNSVRLFLVGRDRGSLHTLRVLAINLGIEDSVVFLGDSTNIPEILCAMDGYVMASHTEGFSNALLEAMAAELPIVATNVGGNAEALCQGELGILVPAREPAALKAAMIKVMAEPALRELLSVAARRMVGERYSVDAMVNAHVELYGSYIAH